MWGDGKGRENQGNNYADILAFGLKAAEKMNFIRSECK
jgi:hypothetical protein